MMLALFSQCTLQYNDMQYVHWNAVLALCALLQLHHHCTNNMTKMDKHMLYTAGYIILYQQYVAQQLHNTADRYIVHVWCKLCMTTLMC